MLKSRTFVKKTRKGNVLKVVREHYLRDDVWCGASQCKNCGVSSSNILEGYPVSLSTNLCSYPHYLLPDTNVVVHQVSLTLYLLKQLSQLFNLSPKLWKSLPYQTR